MKKLLLLLLLVPMVSFGQNIEYVNSKEHKLSGMPFSQATIVNGIIYLSGQIGEVNNVVVEGGIGPETKQALGNIKNILKDMEHSVEDIFKCTCMLSNIKDWPEMSKAYVEFFNRETSFDDKTIVLVLWGFNSCYLYNSFFVKTREISFNNEN